MYFSSPVIIHYTVFEYNNGAIGLAAPPRTTATTHHISAKYNFSREHIGEGKGIMIQRMEYKEHKDDVFYQRIIRRNISIYKEVT